MADTLNNPADLAAMVEANQTIKDLRREVAALRDPSRNLALRDLHRELLDARARVKELVAEVERRYLENAELKTALAAMKNGRADHD